MTLQTETPRTETAHTETLAEAEQAGLRVAIKGRTAALVLLGVFIVWSRSPDPQRAIEFLALFLGFAAIGLIHLKLIGSAYDRRWIKYLMVTIDLAVMSAIIATQPMYDNIDLPQVITYRNSYFPFYFVLLGVSAFSFSPGLVLWTGLIGIVGWMSAFFWTIRGMTTVYDWGDVGFAPTTDDVVRYLFSPNFIGTGSRIQESLAFGVVAILIAVVMYRARRTVMRQLELDEERRLISDVFGKYVPAEVAQTLISDKGALEPMERTATILFVDLAGFTNLTESEGPQRIVEILNAYFDGAAEVISQNKGVITQFQGDAILATFNVPLEDPDHAQNAVKTGIELQKLANENQFGGIQLKVRVGICSGPVIAGNVGGSGRLNYTVHGNTVNMAARLEALNKEYETDILVSASTVDLIDGMQFRRIGDIAVRGISTPVDVYSIT